MVSSQHNTVDAAQIHPTLWRASQLGSGTTECIPSGFVELDRQLPGTGWPTRQLIELLLKHQGIGELRFLMPVLRRLSLERKKLLLLNPPWQPNMQVFAQYGVDTEHVFSVQAQRPHDKVWAIEQTLNSKHFGALLMWLPESQELLPHTVLRRLQYSASRSAGLCFLFRPLRAQNHASPAPLRACLTAQSPLHMRVQLLKRRGPVMEQALTLRLPTPQTALPGVFFDHDLPDCPYSINTEQAPHAVDRNLFDPPNQAQAGSQSTFTS